MSGSRPSRSTSRRNSLSRTHSHSSSITFLPGGHESLVIPDASTSATELLSGFVIHESEATSSTLMGDSNEERGQKKDTAPGGPEREDGIISITQDEEETQEREEMMRRPFYRRPSPWWMLGMVLLSAVAMSTTLAPKVELYTALVCQAIKPEYTVESPISLQRWDSRRLVPPPSKMCGKDPDVQAAVAKLITVMTVFPGILSCLTTGWWGQLSDRHGRTWILSIATIGLLATDFNFILVSRAADRLPGGYLFLLVGPAIDGLFGGMTTLMAGLHAYMSDCTPAHERSRIFSLNSGLLFCGMALGPTLGALLIQATTDLLSVFYVATAAHLIDGLFMWFIIPESLPKSSMRKARKRMNTEREERATAHFISVEQDKISIWARMKNLVKMLFVFLKPLDIFIPYKRLEGKRLDWNLLLMVFSFAFYTFLMGSYQFKFQYAQRAFGWSSETLGYWLSVVSVVRASYLVVILPIFIKILTPKVTSVQLPVSPEEPLHSAQSSSERSNSPSHSVRRPPLTRTASFDLNLARVSLGIELLCYAGMGLARTPATWTVTSILTSFGSGFTPALQSVALALYEQGPNKGTETGRLFGGLSVVQSLSTQIIGPSIFGFTYMSTVSSFPQGIFVVGAGALAFALLFMSLVRVVRGLPVAGHDREETAVARDEE